MASNEKKATDDQIDTEKNNLSASVSDQPLLKALQDFIVPLIRSMDRREEKENNINQFPLGSEAEKLITALREFISSIVRSSPSVTTNTIEVSLIEDLNDGEEDSEEVNDNDGDGDDEAKTSSFEGDPPPKTPSKVENAVTGNLAEKTGTLEKPLPTFHDKLFNALREHVFNAMPIRLLCFQPHGSGLQISLLERGAIHARLESALRANIHEPDHIPQTTSKKKETEEKAIQRLISRYARYAILSHAWLSTAAGEVTYSNWTKGVFDAQDPGYQKLVNFCKTAWKNHGLVFGWMDTVCIDKESSAELDESIRSMFNWYRRAHMCVIYLSETMTVSNMHMDRWFTRGWTLQELLAPRVIKFYNGDWKELVKGSNNDKMVSQTIEQIERATTISEGELSDIYSSPISRRMQLAANRIVTREEDMAYSLMGIFSISISTAYGEGADRAFSRLLREILNSYEEGVLDMLNWAGPLPDSRPHCSMLLPPSPRYYLCRSSIIDLFVGMLGRPIAPLTLTHLGLHIPVILMPAVSISGESIQHDAIGDFNATVDISPDTHYDDFPTTYNVLDKRISGPDGSNKDNNGWYQITLAVFNFGGNKLNLFIPKTCTARGMEFV